MQHWLYARGGVQLTITAADEHAASLLSLALGGMGLASTPQIQGIQLLVTTLAANARWSVQDSSTGAVRELSQVGDLIYHLSDRVVFHIADKTLGQHCLHAAAVSGAGTALVIPASSGAGKSSLTAWLVAHGFAYLTDELILVDSANHIQSIARPLQIKSAGLNAISPLIQNNAEVFNGRIANAITASALGGHVGAEKQYPVGAFLFPQYGEHLAYKFARLSSAEAGLRLMSNHVNARNLQDHGFRRMMQLIRETPCYGLEYGGFVSLPDNFSAQLRELLR